MPNERILVVDDKPLILDIAGRILTKEGFQVVSASSGYEALGIMEKLDFDLLLTDIKMPGMGGMELLRIFKERRPDAAAVIFTGYGTMDTATEAMGIGANGFVSKPFTKSDLVKVVNMAFEKVRLMRENVRLRSLVPLFDVSRKLMERVNREELLSYVADVVLRETGADTVSVLLKKEGSLVVEEQYGGKGCFGKGDTLGIGEGFAGRVAERGIPLLLREDRVCPEDAAEMAEKGISSALILPIKVENDVLGVLNVIKCRGNLPPFVDGDMDFMSILVSQAAVALKNAMLVEDMKDLFMSSIRSLSMAIDAKSPWTAGHSERVTSYALELGRELGLSDTELNELELAGLLHDMGKIGILETILDKPGRLTDDEYEMVKNHPVKGAEMIEPIRQLGRVLPTVRHHHEHYDGTGYPDGLKGNEIPLKARILAVADSYDAMKANRPYRQGRDLDFIIMEFKRCSGKQFDPQVVEAFMKCFGTDKE